MNEQTSRKSGMKSTAKKLQPGSRARFGFDPAPASHKVAGAFGKEGLPQAPETDGDQPGPADGDEIEE